MLGWEAPLTARPTRHLLGAWASSMDQFLAYTVVGIVAGCIYAITAAGLVVTYTTTGIFNFAHGAVGMVSAFAYWQLSSADAIGPLSFHLSQPVAALVVIFVMAPLFGAA